MNKNFRQQAEEKWEKLKAEDTVKQSISLEEQFKESEIERIASDLYNKELLKKVDLQEKKIEQLQEHYLLLSAILDILPTAVFVKDIKENFKFLLWNKRAEALLGLTKEACIGKTDYDFFQKDEADWFRQKDIEASQMKKVLDIPEELIEVGGKSIILHTQKRAILNKKGEPCFLVGIAQDITERKLAEEELRTSKNQLEALFEVSPDFMLKIRISDLKFVDINERASAFYGYSKEEFQQLNLYEVEKQLPKELFNNGICDKLSVGEVVTIKGLHQKKDGTTFPVLARICKIDADYELVAITDISEQQDMITILRESEELRDAKKKAEANEQRLKEAQQIAHIGYWELDNMTNKELWSDELYRIFELDPQEISPCKESFLINLHPEDRGFAHNTYVQMMKTKLPYHISYRLLLANGKLKYVEERCQSEFDEEGKPLRSIGTLQDITDQKIAEENLKKSIKKNQDLQYALDQSAMVLMLDKDCKILSANLNFCQTSGYSEKELLGQSFEMADTTYHSKWFLKNIWSIVEKGTVWKGELKNKTKDNQVYWVDTSIIPLLNEDKKTIRLIIIQKDITDKKQLQEDLELLNEAEFIKLYQLQKLHIAEIKEQNRELDRFFNLSMDMISVVTFDGFVKRVNPAFLKVLGYEEAQLLSKPLYDLIHPNDLVSTQKQADLMAQGQDLLNYENRYRTIHGDYRWLAWRVVLDLESKLCYAISRDITEEKNASRKIEDLTFTLDQTAMVMVVGRDEIIISVNDKFCETSGYSREEAVGQHHEILDSNYHSSSFWKELRATIESGKIWQGEIKEQAKDGSTYWTYTSSVPFVDEEGAVYQYIVIQADISTQKILQEDLRKAKEEAVKNAKIKEDFLANMSHEIRTPMSGVLGFSGLLLETNLNETQFKYAQLIYSCAENLLVVVNDILDVSKIESGKFNLDKINFGLQKMINDTIHILQISAQQKCLNLLVNIEENVPDNLLGAPNRIAQILINLIGNAIKFTKEGFISLNVKVVDVSYLLFEIKDTGIGIPEDKLEVIFESFTQAANYTTREQGGTGLGLSICKKLVTLMGGKIGVESVLGEGTTFYFTIPFNENKDLALGYHNDRIPTKTCLPFSTLKELRVLVVEDNMVNQELAMIYLNKLNCKGVVANNGLEALEQLKKESFDLILMDIQMPLKDGIETTLEIRKFDVQTPIIAITAHALFKEKKRCFEIGMNDYITKPFKIEELQKVILQYTRAEIDLQEKPVKIITELVAEDLSFVANIAHLVEVMDGNKDLAHELLAIFKEELIKFIQNMDLAFREVDKAVIKKHLHKIKPNFELLQLMNLYNISDAISNLIVEDAAWQEIKLLYQKIENIVPILLKEIDKTLQEV